jgi:hypothetical protein
MRSLVGRIVLGILVAVRDHDGVRAVAEIHDAQCAAAG